MSEDILKQEKKQSLNGGNLRELSHMEEDL